MINVLLPFLQRQAIILTPNQRLAATLLKQYNQHQLLLNKRCWETPCIRPLRGWMQELWTKDMAKKMDGSLLLLSTDQELILWEEFISKAPECEQVLKRCDLAKQAKSAWSTLKQWCISYEHSSFSLSENARHFQGWARQFAKHCHEKQWIDHASLTPFLIEKIQAGELALPQELVLVNFTELTPLDKAFLQASERQGVQIEQLEYQAETLAQKDRHRQCSFADEETEIQTMVRFAKKTLEDHPSASIGCIADQLEEKRESILSAFKEIFDNPAHYNISAGQPLTAYPLIQQALQLLSLPKTTLPLKIVQSLLHSPFIGEAETERFERIQLDSDFRQQNQTQFSFSSLLQEPSLQNCPLLKSRIKQVHDLQQESTGHQKISQWLLHFTAILEAFGWPGELSLNSTEYQVLGRWLHLLEEAQTLDLVLAPLDFSKAVYYLKSLAAKTYFQPESPDAPIQILGQLEGAGLPFDYLWVLGLNDRAWPPLPSPNPFIPHELQKTLKMPLATAEKQLAYSRRLMEQYQNAAKQAIFSYARHNDKEELRPSPLLAALPHLPYESLALAPQRSSIKTIFETQRLETYQDEQAPPLNKVSKLKGGVRIFEMQAACPFKAFASLRLGAAPLEESQKGLPARHRGSIIHKALELFWNELQNQANLKALTSSELQNKIKNVIGLALNQLAPFIQAHSLYKTLISQRLETQLSTWLELEKSRPPFKVLALEQEKTILINQFSLTLRVDRIDQLATGEELIIDYKTKKVCNPKDWFSNRPEEPQLPLYCISAGTEVSGLAYAQLHTTKTELIGLTQTDFHWPSLKPLNEKSKADALTWDGQLEEWRQNLNQLFQDYQDGRAEVDPKHPVETCRHCHLKTFCRIHENQAESYEQTD